MSARSQVVLLPLLLLLLGVVAIPMLPFIGARNNFKPTTTPSSNISTHMISSKGMEDTGMLVQLDKLVKQNPKKERVVVEWFVEIGGEDGTDDELLYNRKDHQLTYSSHLGVLCNTIHFGKVTDKAIGVAAKNPPRSRSGQHITNREQYWVKSLVKAGSNVISTSFD